jgi:hypothetical protein
MKKSLLPVVMLGTMLGLGFSSAWAGRPLTVDDANVNDKGAGHVETWAARESGKVNTLNIAPAYAPIDGLELGALLSRDTTSKTNLSAIQAKWRITPSQEKGCNTGAVLGVAHESNGGGNLTYLNGLFSCNGNALGNVHLNLGMAKAKDISAKLTWGAAIEHELAAVTPHIEVFGGEGQKPTYQAGVRGQLTKTLQLDGNVGRTQGETLYSVGLKFQF